MKIAAFPGTYYPEAPSLESYLGTYKLFAVKLIPTNDDRLAFKRLIRFLRNKSGPILGENDCNQAPKNGLQRYCYTFLVEKNKPIDPILATIKEDLPAFDNDSDETVLTVFVTNERIQPKTPHSCQRPLNRNTKLNLNDAANQRKLLEEIQIRQLKRQQEQQMHMQRLQELKKIEAECKAAKKSKKSLPSVAERVPSVKNSKTPSVDYALPKSTDRNILATEEIQAEIVCEICKRFC